MITPPVPHPFYLNTMGRHIAAATPFRPDHSIWPVVKLLGAVLLVGIVLGALIFGRS